MSRRGHAGGLLRPIALLVGSRALGGAFFRLRQMPGNAGRDGAGAYGQGIGHKRRGARAAMGAVRGNRRCRCRNIDRGRPDAQWRKSVRTSCAFFFQRVKCTCASQEGSAIMHERGRGIALNDYANLEERSVPRPAKPLSPRVGAKEFSGSLKPEAREFQLRRLERKSELSALARSASPREPPELESGAAPAAPAPPPQEMARREFAPRFAPGAATGAPLAGSNAVAESAPAAGPIGGLGSGSAATIISVRTADGVERWRLGANGSIQHREPDGSWQEQSSGVSSPLWAAAAPSPTTCWIVGSAGTILRTIDGEHWQRIDSPTQADLIAVFAIDSSNAIITAADGRRFTTTDAGRTWRPL